MNHLVVDKAHSEVAFQVRHLVTRVRGRFTDFEGVIDADDDHPDKSTVTFTINTASVDTNTADRDNHLRSEDFFHAEKFPTIAFKSKSVQKTGAEEYKVSGDLTIRGVTRPLVLPVTALGMARDPWGNMKAGFEAETTLNRKDFGLNWNAALEAGGFLVGDEVKISLSIHAVVQP
jgi:polyisoprenoid-binding protein YceI